MLIVDTHAHASPYWFEPVETLLDTMARFGVARSLMVQTSGHYDNSYQQGWANREPEKLASLVAVDVAAPDVKQTMKNLAADGAVGVRFRANAPSRSDSAYDLWRAAQELGLVVSCLGSPEEFASTDFRDLAKRIPDLKIVVEHLGIRPKMNAEPDDGMAAKVYELSSLPNIYMKFHGLGEFAQRAKPQQMPPFVNPLPNTLRLAFEAFGPSRMIWGSDFPLVSSREGYALALTLPQEELRSYGATEADLAQMFGEVANKLFWRAGSSNTVLPAPNQKQETS